MIVTRLHGRLGNQMFQYAAGLGLAARRGVALAWDAREVRARGEGCLADVFDLPAPPEAPPLPPDRRRRPLAYYAWRALGRRPHLVRERGLSFDHRLLEAPDGSYLHGYWQSERYFAHVADRLRADFTFRAPARGANAGMAARIGAANAISLHVRRGDYLAAQPHGLCEQAYYDAALAWLLPRAGENPVIFVFSDDTAWARDNLALPVPRVVVDINDAAAGHEDMRLMALCRHHVIANSSFSWWGAWLGGRADGHVAAPTRWFADPGRRNPDILPAHWHPVAV